MIHNDPFRIEGANPIHDEAELSGLEVGRRPAPCPDDPALVEQRPAPNRANRCPQPARDGQHLDGSAVERHNCAPDVEKACQTSGEPRAWTELEDQADWLCAWGS